MDGQRSPGRPTFELHLDAAQAHRVERRSTDLFVERDAVGTYSDIGTDSERELLDALTSTPWREVVEERFAAAHPWLHRIITDRGRSLFLDVVSLPAGGCFLDVGSGWGQVAIPLARLGRVFCLDLTPTRLDIVRAIARQENADLGYVCGNFQTFPFAEQQFDLVLFNGSLEWIAVGNSATSIREAQRAALSKARRLLKPGGLVYIGIENAMGLKYLLGAPDDHTGIAYLSLLDEDRAADRYATLHDGARLPAKTWSLREYTALVDSAGLAVEEIYGCFPDYKLIRAMVPLAAVNSFVRESELPAEHSGSDGSALDCAALLPPIYRQLASNGVAQYFCPSYGIVAKRPE